MKINTNDKKNALYSLVNNTAQIIKVGSICAIDVDSEKLHLTK